MVVCMSIGMYARRSVVLSHFGQRFGSDAHFDHHSKSVHGPVDADSDRHLDSAADAVAHTMSKRNGTQQHAAVFQARMTALAFWALLPIVIFVSAGIQ